MGGRDLAHVSAKPPVLVFQRARSPAMVGCTRLGARRVAVGEQVFRLLVFIRTSRATTWLVRVVQWLCEGGKLRLVQARELAEHIGGSLRGGVHEQREFGKMSFSSTNVRQGKDVYWEYRYNLFLYLLSFFPFDVSLRYNEGIQVLTVSLPLDYLHM